jgi:hypothetical protein
MPTFTIEVKGLNITMKGLRKMSHTVPRIAGMTNLRLSKKLIEYAKQNVRNRVRFKPNTGKLERGIRTISRGRNNSYIVIGSTAHYSSEVEFGTPSRINMNYMRIPLKLRMGWKGNTTYPFIKHPGSRPMNFMTDAILRMKHALEIGTSHQNDIRRALVDIWKNSFILGEGLKGSVFFRNIK